MEEEEVALRGREEAGGLAFRGWLLSAALGPADLEVVGEVRVPFSLSPVDAEVDPGDFIERFPEGERRSAFGRRHGELQDDEFRTG